MKNKSYIYIIFLGIVCMLSSCITTRQTRFLQGGDSYKPVAFQQYELQINDEIAYYLMTSNAETQALYNNGQVGGTFAGRTIGYRIFEDGTVRLPIGPVKVAGLTLREAEETIRNAFLRVVPDAEIRLSMSNNVFFIEGDGMKGRGYLYKENLNIFQALAMTNDIPNSGDRSNVKIIRRGADGMDHIKIFDLREESIIESEFYYIKPNDVIYVPANPNVFFRIESISSFMSLIVTPLSFFTMVISLLRR